MLFFLTLPAFVEVIKTEDPSSIDQLLKEGDLILLDLDKTTMMPQGRLFLPPKGEEVSEGSEFLKGLQDHPENEVLMSQFFLNRKTQLVHAHWPKLIAQWRKKGLPVYALTQRPALRYGAIPHVSLLSAKEVQNLGLFFTPTFQDKDHFFLSKQGLGSEKRGEFFQGIFSTGDLTKGEVIHHILRHHRPSRIVFVDDRKKHIADVQAACEKENMPFLGFYFRAVDSISFPPLPEGTKKALFSLQKISLFHGKWLGDAEALALLFHERPGT